jgi:3-isopropylmalate dehydratase small subunit
LNVLQIGPVLAEPRGEAMPQHMGMARAPEDRRHRALDETPVTVDVEKQEVRFGDRVIKATVPDGPRNQLVAGTWDSTAVLLEAGAAIEATAGKLPYVTRW